jgi:ribosomal protein S27AE
MGDTRTTCPKCGSAMDAGYLPDMGHGVVFRSWWNPGIPEIRRFVGGIRWKQKEAVAMTAWRCVKCGFVELYATS